MAILATSGACLTEFPRLDEPKPCKIQADCKAGELCAAQPGGRRICEEIDAGDTSDARPIGTGGTGGAPDALIGACPPFVSLELCDVDAPGVCAYAPPGGTLPVATSCRDVCVGIGMNCQNTASHGADACEIRQLRDTCGDRGGELICLCQR